MLILRQGSEGESLRYGGFMGSQNKNNNGDFLMENTGDITNIVTSPIAELMGKLGPA